MDENLETKIDFKDRLTSVLTKHKKKFYFLFLIFILIIISIFALNMYYKKQNLIISEKYITAGLNLNLNNKDKAKFALEEIIESKNKFYSILALNTILEKELESNEDVIISYFDILQDLSIPPEQKDLLIFKKALYLIQVSKTEEGERLLRKLSNSDSYLKNISDQILEN